jgi:peptidoglycan/LPS O-acetylase OafA/YrhL
LLTSQGREGAPIQTRLLWVEQLKAVALIWIFLNHVVERLLDTPLIANPNVNWPPYHQRLAQLLTPLAGHGWANVPLNLVRYLGWFGDQGVQLFLIASGFGLTWGLLARQGNAPLPSVKDFLWRRAERIYPLWWAVHILFAISYVMIGWGIAPNQLRFWLSAAGLRITPATLYFFSPAWWFIGLLIQLYLIYPVLWNALRKRGPAWLLAVTLAISLPVRLAGLLVFHGYLDAWSRGAIFITRLPELVFGVCLAAWLHSAPAETDRWLRRGSTLSLSLLTYAAATFLSLTLAGMAVAPFLLGAAAFVGTYAALRGMSKEPSRRDGLLVWIGRHSYSLYLLHHPFIHLVLPERPANPRLGITLLRISVVVVMTAIGAIVLEKVVARMQEHLVRSYRRSGLIGPAWRVSGVILLVAGCALGSELAVRRFAPQEVYGWGERPSLQPDPEFTYRLKPSHNTRLRWLTYDYRVHANSLGFPGPEYPVAKPPGTLRILTTGDAFTSAEGVDTSDAWPRLLESDVVHLRPQQPAQVLNFAITGYGPNQYAAVIKHFAPVYRPDIIIIGFFVNDFQDVLRSDQQFRDAIGFGSPNPESISSVLHFVYLKRYVRARILQPIRNRINHVPSPSGLMLGNFAALEPNTPPYLEGTPLVAARFREIGEVARGIHARVIVAMIPASIQVCAPSQLAYFPDYVSLQDKSKFDLDLPQRTARDLAGQAGFEFYDLRPILKSVPGGCPYQRHNMHWTKEGHQAVAEFLTRALIH